MAEEWVKKARNDAKNKVYLCLETEKALRAAKEENNELLSKLTVKERERKSVKAGLKNAQTQAENQYKLLYQTEIKLTTSRQFVLELKAELQKAKKAAQLAKEAAEAEKQASYALGVEETQAGLIEELAEVCRDYCMVSWAEVLNLERVPTDSEWRQPRNVYYHPEIREIPGALPSPSTTTPESSEQLLTAQAALPLPKASKEPSQAGNQGQGVNGVKDKGKGKRTKPFSEDKDAAKAKEAAAKVKEAEAKTKEVDPKAKDALAKLVIKVKGLMGLKTKVRPRGPSPPQRLKT